MALDGQSNAWVHHDCPGEDRYQKFAVEAVCYLAWADVAVLAASVRRKYPPTLGLWNEVRVAQSIASRGGRQEHPESKSLAPDGNPCKADTRGLLQRADVIAGEIRYIGKETDRKWEEGDEISILEFKTTEYGRSKKIIASDEVKKQILEIGINKCARESGFDRKNFIRKLIRGIPVKRNSYNEFVRWLTSVN